MADAIQTAGAAGPEPMPRWIAVVLLVLGGLAALFAVAWVIAPEAFAGLFRVEYGYARANRNFARNLGDFPKLLACLAAVLIALGVATRRNARAPAFLSAAGTRPGPLPGWFGWSLVVGLFGVAAALSHRSWVYWNRPRWDGYSRFADAFYHLFAQPGAAGAEQFRAFLGEYLHAASPLTPALAGLLRFAVPDPVLCLQLLNALATAASVALVAHLGRRLAPSLPAWLVAALLLTNAAVIRNSWFVQLDAASSAVALVFFWRLSHWLETGSSRDAAWTCLCATLGLFQKTTLLPLLAIPTAVTLYRQWGARRLRLGALVRVAAWSAAVPLALFAAYVVPLELVDNVGRQVEVMGVGWNVADHSWQRFGFGAAFLLGPYLPFLAFGWSRSSALRFGLVSFALLFLLGIAVTGGPFWSRYYSHIAGPCLLAAAPALARFATLPGSRAAVLLYLGGCAAVSYTMMALELF